MERVFVLPDPGEGLEEAEILGWLANEGDEVELNQPIAEVETAKAAVEIPSPYAGTIVKLHAAAGDSVRVGSPLVTFDVPDVAGTPEVARSRVAATPAVRRLAKQLGVDLAGVAATGPGGRITSEDVARASGAAAETAVPAPAGADEMPVTPVRREIAENLARQALIPQVTTFRTLDCTAVESFRSEIEVSPLPVVIAALARAAADHPLLNASWGGDRIWLHRGVHVGIAVDTDRGLVVPVVRGAGALGVSALAEEIRRLAEGARADSLAPDEYSGATVAVSNTGSYGSEAGTPILAPGTSITLAIGVISPRALVIEGEVVARPAATLSLTFDHRVLDGAAAGRALTDLVSVLQDHDRLRDLPR